MLPVEQAIDNVKFENFVEAVEYMQFQVREISKLDSNCRNNSNKIQSKSRSKLQVDKLHFAKLSFQNDIRSKYRGTILDYIICSLVDTH